MLNGKKFGLIRKRLWIKSWISKLLWNCGVIAVAVILMMFRIFIKLTYPKSTEIHFLPICQLCFSSLLFIQVLIFQSHKNPSLTDMNFSLSIALNDFSWTFFIIEGRRQGVPGGWTNWCKSLNLDNIIGMFGTHKALRILYA